jgi:hypothetical protein
VLGRCLQHATHLCALRMVSHPIPTSFMITVGPHADSCLRNWDLHVTSSCHRIKLFSVNKTRPATAKKLKQYEEAGIPFLPITNPGEMDNEDEDEYDKEMAARGPRDPVE